MSMQFANSDPFRALPLPTCPAACLPRRRIQDYLVRKADKYCVPKVENTNIDRSVSVIHLTVAG